MTFEVQTNFINFRNARVAYCSTGMVSKQETAVQLAICVFACLQGDEAEAFDCGTRAFSTGSPPNPRALLRQLSAVQAKPFYLSEK